MLQAAQVNRFGVVPHGMVIRTFGPVSEIQPRDACITEPGEIGANRCEPEDLIEPGLPNRMGSDLPYFPYRPAGVRSCLE